MKLGSSRRRDAQRRRQRFWLGLLKWSLLLGAVVAAGGYAWYTGSSAARHEVDQLQGENTDLRAQVDKYQSTIAELKGHEAALQKQIPADNIRKLIEIIQGKLDAGVPADRLAFILTAAKADHACEKTPVIKRFFVETPIYQTPGASASFGGNAITLTAEGSPAVDANGRPQAWFDPARPVTVTFTEIGGSATKATGALPLQQSVVVGAWEYRFAITAGTRGTVNVSAERCSYP